MSEDKIDLLQKEEKNFSVDLSANTEKKDFVEILKMFAPGTSLRVGLDDILKMGKGALIVIYSDKLFEILEPGFKVNSRFSSQKLAELAKMDGAIILSKDLKKILYANSFLFPNIKISTKETGTRHKAAERTAKQLKTIVIAISERKRKITIYYGNSKYELGESSEILRRAAETLQILEKQKEMFNNLLINLNISELTNTTTITDVCNILQRIEIIRRISEVVRMCLVELGSEGIIVSMRLRELTKNLTKDRMMILKDYFGSKTSKIDAVLKNLNFDILLELSNVSALLFGDIKEEALFPRGIRILNESNLSERTIKILVNNFKDLNGIFNAEVSLLVKFFKEEEVAFSLKKTLESVGERILAKKKFN
jgi:diadenylate cyclase